MSAALAAVGTEVDDVVGAFYHVEVVLNHHQCVTFGNQAVERGHQYVDVVEVKAGCGLVEYEHGGGGAFVGDERSQFHALVLTARKRRGRLAEFDVTQSDIVERLEAPHDAAFCRAGPLAEKLDGLVDGHVKDIADVYVAVFHLEYFLFETLAAAHLTGDGDVGEELHRDGDGAFALALFAPASLGVERKERRGETHLLCCLLLGEEVADFIVCFQVCGRIGTRRLADGVLVDEDYVAHAFEVAAQLAEASGRGVVSAEVPGHGAVEDVADQG